MEKPEAILFIENRIIHKKESLTDQADSLIRRLEGVKRILAKPGHDTGGLNELGELQSGASSFEASIGFLCGLADALSALRSGDDNGD